MNNHTQKHKCEHACQNQGITLLEVLLYIGLFSVVCISMIYLCVGISKTATSIKVNTQRAELSLFIYEIVRYRLDHAGQNLTQSITPIIAVEDFSRILTYYPNLKMIEINIENLRMSAPTTRPEAYSGFKITYKLSQKGVNMSAEKIFSHSFYVIM